VGGDQQEAQQYHRHCAGQLPKRQSDALLLLLNEEGGKGRCSGI
jgi:hypothetical protein